MAQFLCCVNLIIEPKEKGGSGREERRMRRSCRYRRRRSHSLCRDVRGVGGCTLHRWGLCCTLEEVSTSKGSRCHVCTPLLLFSSSAFAAPGTSSRTVGPFLRPIHKEPLWKRAASWCIFSERKYFQRKYWTAQRTFQEDTTCTFNESSAGLL